MEGSGHRRDGRDSEVPVTNFEGPRFRARKKGGRKMRMMLSRTPFVNDSDVLVRIWGVGRCKWKWGRTWKRLGEMGILPRVGALRRAILGIDQKWPRY